MEIFQPVGADDASKHVPLVIEILSCLYLCRHGVLSGLVKLTVGLLMETHHRISGAEAGAMP